MVLVLNVHIYDIEEIQENVRINMNGRVKERNTEGRDRSQKYLNLSKK